MAIPDEGAVYGELTAIIDHMNPDDVAKIPNELIEHFRKNADPNHTFNCDTSLELNELDLLDGTKAFLYDIYKAYFATPEEPEELNQIAEEYRRKKKHEEYQKIMEEEEVF